MKNLKLKTKIYFFGILTVMIIFTGLVTGQNKVRAVSPELITDPSIIPTSTLDIPLISSLAPTSDLFIMLSPTPDIFLAPASDLFITPVPSLEVVSTSTPLPDISPAPSTEIVSVPLSDIYPASSPVAPNIVSVPTPAPTAFSNNTSVIKVTWEMVADKENDKYSGTDDSADAGAQFIPFGKYQKSKRIAFCAIVADTVGGPKFNNANGSIFYPKNAFLGPNHDAARQGCGQLIEQSQMSRLSKNDGIDLFCNKIKNNNNNLPVFNGDFGSYDDICKIDGGLENETSGVYCGEKDLLYDDPSGVYSVKIDTQDDRNNIFSLENSFTYLPFSAFETDFNSIEYGIVKARENKTINGDLIWGNGIPTVRNIGNTRLNIEIVQGDMGFGKTDEYWNIEFGAKIGENETSWIFFNEGMKQKLQNTLNLSETNEIDFSILVRKFPLAFQNRYNGNFALNVVSEDHLNCDGILIAKSDLIPNTGIASVSIPNTTSEVESTVSSSGNPAVTPDILPDFLPSPDASVTPVPAQTSTSGLCITPTPSPNIAFTPALQSGVVGAPGTEILSPSLISDPLAAPSPAPDIALTPSVASTSDLCITPTPAPDIAAVPASTPTLLPDISPTPIPGPIPTLVPDISPSSILESAPTLVPDIPPDFLPSPDASVTPIPFSS